MRLDKALKDKLLDVRLRDKLIAEGKITQAEVDAYFKSLNDESDNFEYSVADTNDVEETEEPTPEYNQEN